MTSTELDALLASWAGRQQLSPTTAETIRHAVVAEPTTDPLPATWWRDFTLRMSEQMVRASRPRIPTLGSA